MGPKFMNALPGFIQMSGKRVLRNAVKFRLIGLEISLRKRMASPNIARKAQVARKLVIEREKRDIPNAKSSRPKQPGRD